MASGRRIPIEIDIPTPEPPPPEPPVTDSPHPEPDPDPFRSPNQNPALSRETIVYDTIEDSYSRIPASRDARMGHFYGKANEGTGGDRLYVFGGYKGNANLTDPLRTSGEVFDIIDQEWSYIADMPTARAFGMSAQYGTTIYCIGGIEISDVSNKFEVSRKIESFNTATGIWNPTLKPMPEEYGVAYGDAQVAGEYIYVTCGFTNFKNQSDPGDLNNRILRYSIQNDSWDIIVPSDENLYRRISPFGFYRDNEKDVDTAGLSVSTDQYYYIVGGSIPKDSADQAAELEDKIDRLVQQYMSFVNTSDFFNTMSNASRDDLINEEIAYIRSSTRVSAYVYPFTGFKFQPGSETIVNGNLVIDISNKIDNEWPVIPAARDDGQAVYIPSQDTVYFLGGSNQNISATLNRVESISLQDNSYDRLAPMEQGRIRFAAVGFGSDIYILGGQTSGHSPGYVQINIQQFPGFVRATGTQSNGFLVTLTNDAGDVIEGDVRIAVRGQVRISEVDDLLIDFFADTAVNRIRDQLPQVSDEAIEDLTEQEILRLVSMAQNNITNPNADEYQINSAKKLNTEVWLFPILYNQTDFIVSNGVGGFMLKPRSEDPLHNIQRLSAFIEQILDGTVPSENERFLGDLTREELAALGNVLQAVELPPVVINSGSNRTLYDIETFVTVIDEHFFGQTVSNYDEKQLSAINDALENELKNIGESDNKEKEEVSLTSSSNFVRYNITDNIFGAKTEDGQSTSSLSKIPLYTTFKDQLPSIITTYYNNIDWIPQVNEYFTDGNATISEAVEQLDILDHEIPFGGSQLYSAMSKTSTISSGDAFEDLKKSVYIVSDNSENLSLITRDDAIDEINSIDGYGKVPVIYTVFSTSEPISVASMVSRAEKTDIEKITEETNGQSTTLVNPDFLSQILNLTIQSAAGGLGYGVYTRLVEFDELTAITALAVDFLLPSNTIGTIRYRYSTDGFNFSDWSEKYEGTGGSQSIDVVDLFAKSIEFNVILGTGFTVDMNDDVASTGYPKLLEISMDISGEKIDYLFLNTEDVDLNVQQAAVAFEGHVPENGIVEIGVATSDSHHWDDFQSEARPALREASKTFLLERSHDETSIVPDETLWSEDGLLWYTTYGPWDPAASVTLVEVVDSSEVTVRDNFRFYPRQGQVCFGSPQPVNKTYRLRIINDDVIRVGLKLRNRLHSDNIDITGVGYIYSTNDDKPNDLVQLAPIAENVTISPTTEVTAGSVFTGYYDYKDPNGDPEDGSVYKWYINTQNRVQLTGKLTWSNNDLPANKKLQPNDSIVFSVTPSDGFGFGQEVFSDPVTLGARAPSVGNVVIYPTHDDEEVGVYDTSSTLHLDYEYTIEDIGPSSVEQGTVITWYIDGTEVKTGEYSNEMGEDADILKLDPGEGRGDDFVAHEIGATVSIEIIAQSKSGLQGQTYNGSLPPLENTIPEITNPSLISIEPSDPTPGVDDLKIISGIGDMVYDLDIGAIGNDQTLTIETEWYRSVNGITYEPVAISGSSGPYNSSIVDKSLVEENHWWKVVVTPFDGFDRGTSYESDPVKATYKG